MFHHLHFNLPSSCWQIWSLVTSSMICCVLLLHDVLWAVFVAGLSNNRYEMFIAFGLDQTILPHEGNHGEQKQSPTKSSKIYELLYNLIILEKQVLANYILQLWKEKTPIQFTNMQQSKNMEKKFICPKHMLNSLTKNIMIWTFLLQLVRLSAHVANLLLVPWQIFCLYSANFGFNSFNKTVVEFLICIVTFKKSRIFSFFKEGIVPADWQCTATGGGGALQPSGKIL